MASEASAVGRLARAAALAVCGLAAGRASVAAADYPNQPVTLVVPSASGSASDLVARVVGDRLSRTWRQPVVVANIPGGGLNIGAQRVASAPPDGLTLLVAPPPPLTINDLLYTDLHYDPGAFTPITVLTRVPNALIVRQDLPVGSVAELIAYAKDRPGVLTYGSQGVGSTAHLAAKLFEKLAGVTLVHVPYRGEAPILTDIVGQHIDIFFSALSSPLPLQQAGRLKILAVGSRERSRFLPATPTFIEAGLPGFESTTWYAMAAPPRTPEAIAAKLNADAVEALADASVGDRLRQLNLEPVGGGRAETAAFFAKDKAFWRGVIEDAAVEKQRFE